MLTSVSGRALPGVSPHGSNPARAFGCARAVPAGPGVRIRRASRLLLASAVLVLLGLIAARLLADARVPRAQAPRGLVELEAGLGALPASAQGPISASLGAADPHYAILAGGSGFSAVNREQRLRLHFSASGTEVASAALRARLSLASIAYGSTLVAPSAAHAFASANTLTLARGELSESYRNGPLGLEQGFTLARTPSADAAGGLSLTLALAGNARAALSPDGRSVLLSHGGVVLRYGGMVARDASGRLLGSRLAVRPGALLLSVDTARAKFPVTIDPLLEQAKLVPEAGAGHFGRSVALSADGNTALIGEPHFEGSVGSARIFTRSGTSWTEQAHLEGEQLQASSYFGRGVALSSDGDVALVGDPGANQHAGGAWVFTRSGSAWTMHAALVAGEEIGPGEFGRSVALSQDGSTALVGGWGDDKRAGAAWVFKRSGEEWLQQGGKLTAADETGAGMFGRNVALSADGSTALIGGPFDDESAGAAWVFTRSGEAWSPQGGKLTPGDETGAGEFGSAVSLSADGTTALIGAVHDAKRAGAAWVFVRSGAGWSQQGAKLVGSEAVGTSAFGSSVALSGDGGTALIGGLGDDSNVGAAWVFTRSSAGWAQQGNKLTVPDEIGEGQFGWSAALSADASTALVGGIGDNNEAGAVWAFAVEASPANPSPAPTPTQQVNTGATQQANSVTGQATSGVSGSQTQKAPGLPAPVLGQSTNVAAVSGTVLLQLPGSNTWVRLVGAMHIPFGTIIDARHGVVTVTVVGHGGQLMTARYFLGEFRLTQQPNGMVVATLYGGSSAQCRRSGKKASLSRAAHIARRRSVRKLWTNAHGTFTTKGTYAAGAVQGTEWLVEDFCEGTLVVVTRDRVKVTDLVHHHNRVVRAGHRLFVHA
jgi:FG-GAP repeat